jgi:hypothetical protein
MKFTLDNIKPAITINSILSSFSEEYIYKLYCSDFPKNLCHSPFRKDKNPSFSFYKRQYWRWKDLKSKEGGGVFEFVQKFEGTQNLNDTLHKLYNRLNMNIPLGYAKCENYKTNSTPVKKLAQYVMHDEFKDFEIKTLQLWNISIAYCKWFNTGTAKQVFLNRELIWTFSINNPIFYYHFPETNNVRAYRPLEKDKKRKHFGVVNGLKDIFGLTQLRSNSKHHRIIVITKAMKEVIFFKTFGITAIALCGEGYYFSKELMDEIKSRCDYLISFYDADKAGWHGAWILRKAFNIPAFFIPSSWNAKNITDLWETDYKKCYKVLELLLQLPYSTNTEKLKYKNKIIR